MAGFQSWMQRMGQGLGQARNALLPVPEEVASQLDPRTIEALRRQAVLQAGLGMMSAGEKGQGLGTGALYGLDQAQQGLGQGLNQAWLGSRARREDQRVEQYDRRLTVAEERDARREAESLARYAEEKAYRDQKDAEDREQWQKDFNLRSATRGGTDKPGYGSPQTGKNPETGKIDQFIVDDYGNVKWLGIEPPEPSAGISVGPDGQLVAAGIGKASGEERKVAALGVRLEGSLRSLNGITERNPGSERPTVAERAAEGLPLVGEIAANKIRSSDRQQADAAQLDALDAALTLATGAAYTKEQLQNLRKAYFPQIGDTDETVKAKEARFESIVQAARIAAGRAEPAINAALEKSPAKNTGQNPPVAGVTKSRGYIYVGGDPSKPQSWVKER
jgi:hypothetical protein